MAFKQDLQTFITFLQKTDNDEEAKKEYRRLLKLYHPDVAAEKDKSLYNDYILLINKVYSAGKIQTKEIMPEESPDNSKKREHFNYIFKVARAEYDRGHEILHNHGLNYLDKKAIEQNSLEVMQHYYNTIKCFKYIQKNCDDPVLLSTIEFDLPMVQNAVNMLARTISSSDEKSLINI